MDTATPTPPAPSAADRPSTSASMVDESSACTTTSRAATRSLLSTPAWVRDWMVFTASAPAPLMPMPASQPAPTATLAAKVDELMRAVFTASTVMSSSDTGFHSAVSP